MKIINIVPGFGGTFYCGNCLRDSAYTASLRKAGHDAMTLPMYLPLTINGREMPSGTPVFYGAVNIYLRQQFPFLKNMPAWMEKMLNSPPVLRFAASKSGSTRAEGLEELTESMLLGEAGRQSHELEEVVAFMKVQKPDVIHFSNALLLGMAHRLKTETGARIVCSLQDEDVWVDAMRPDYRQRIWDLLKEKSADVDLFISVSRYFAEVMREKISLPPEKLRVAYIGIDPEAYQFHELPAEPAIGYVSRICHENGFHIVTDAFIRLKKDPFFRNLKLRATGGMTGDDKAFIREQVRKLRRENIDTDLEIFPHFTTSDLNSFFSKVSLVSVPVLNGEAFGLYQLESMASGVPVVQPALGAFPEIVAETGGGIIYQPNDPSALAEAVSGLLKNLPALNELKIRAREGAAGKFNSDILLEKMISILK